MDSSIFDDPRSFDHFMELERVKMDLRKEFIDVYNRNEIYYQNYIKYLNGIIKSKEDEIQKLIDLLHKETFKRE